MSSRRAVFIVSVAILFVERPDGRDEGKAELSGDIESIWVTFCEEVEVLSIMRRGTFPEEFHAAGAGFLLNEPRIILLYSALESFHEVERRGCEGVHIRPYLHHVGLVHNLLQERDGVLQRNGVRRAYLQE